MLSLITLSRIKLITILTFAAWQTACVKTQTVPVDIEAMTQTKCPAELNIPDCLLTLYQDQPFTGIQTRGQPGDRNFQATQYLNGLAHGFGFSASKTYLSSSRHYQKGKLHGENVQYHFQSSHPNYRRVYLEGEMVEQSFYNEQGVIISHYRYQDGKEVESQSYHQGRPSMHKKLVDGEQHQNWKLYHGNGQLAKDTYFEKFPRILKELEYYSNGQIKRDYRFNQADNTATQKTYSYKGWLTSEQNYSYRPDVARHGEWRRYYDGSDQLISIEHYQQDKLHGEQSYYHHNGKFEKQINYNNGVIIDSEVLTYSDEGWLFKRQNYDNSGKLIRTIYYHESGEVMSDDQSYK